MCGRCQAWWVGGYRTCSSSVPSAQRWGWRALRHRERRGPSDNGCAVTWERLSPFLTAAMLYFASDWWAVAPSGLAEGEPMHVNFELKDGSVTFWETKNGKPRRRLSLDNFVTHVTRRPNR